MPSRRYDGDELKRKWLEGEDPEGASVKSVRYFGEILDGRINPLNDLEMLKAAVEPGWDGPHGQIHVVHMGLEKVEVFVYDAEKKLPLGAPEQLAMQAMVQRFMAQSWHRKRNYRQATLVAFNMIKRLEDLVGREQLLEIIGRPTANAIAEAAVEVLGVLVAALRRAEAKGGFKPATAEQIHQVAFNLVRSYLGPNLKPAVIYPGTDALAAQWFYRFVHDPEAPEQLVKALFDLDVATRPDWNRSRVTAHARDAEYAAYLGDLERARREGRSFVSALERFGMVRHLATIREQGYFAY
jgi:hypothetical protein